LAGGYVKNPGGLDKGQSYPKIIEEYHFAKTNGTLWAGRFIAESLVKSIDIPRPG
jgi:hypothetical protein